MNNFLSFLQSHNFIVLDGAMGTELQNRGYRTELPLWSAKANLDAKDLVYQIHYDYIQAGADIITTNTFRTQKHTFQKINNPNLAEQATINAVQIAIKAKKRAFRDVFVGGSLTTLEDCYQPNLVPNEAILREDHKRQTQLLAELGVDFLFCEAINTIREAKILAEFAQNTPIPFFMSFVINDDGNLLNGESLFDAIEIINKFKPTAILVNCRPIDILQKTVDTLINSFSGVKGIYPNGQGKPANDLGWDFHQQGDDIKKFTAHCRIWAKKGIKILGGCCGTNVEYIQALRSMLDQL
ncbi:hypothetical protein A2335_01700 [Candidatus Peregrinibacteria bacterium RIFOXYB2_FULL_32_7]|nr:MAG: hypothetical protein A2335_01700 [Candidatus Peregrinibacteria bacterium RIFOXYB2_FULL_32_7]